MEKLERNNKVKENLEEKSLILSDLNKEKKNLGKDVK